MCQPGAGAGVIRVSGSVRAAAVRHRIAKAGIANRRFPWPASRPNMSVTFGAASLPTGCAAELAGAATPGPATQTGGETTNTCYVPLAAHNYGQ